MKRNSHIISTLSVINPSLEGKVGAAVTCGCSTVPSEYFGSGTGQVPVGNSHGSLRKIRRLVFPDGVEDGLGRKDDCSTQDDESYDKGIGIDRAR